MADILSNIWSEVASDNSAAPPDGWPEGMARSAVNNAAREIMGAIKRMVNRAFATRASVTTLTDAGSLSTAYQVDYTVPPPTYAQGQVFAFRADKGCGAAPKLKVNTLAQLPLLKATAGGVKPLERGDIVAGQIVVCSYDGLAGGFIVTSMLAPAATGGAQPGDLRITAADNPGAGWLPCDGRELSRTTYAALFAAIGTKYGAGDNSTTFNILDCRGRALVGAENMPGGATLPPGGLRISTQGSGVTAGWAGGEAAHVLSVSEMPQHTHSGTTDTRGSHTHGGSTSGVGDHAHSGWTDAQGQHAHNAWTDIQGQHIHGSVAAQVWAGSTGGGFRSVVFFDQPYMQQYDLSQVMAPAGAHGHNIGMDAAGNHAHNVATYGAGAHSHSISTDAQGAHQHNLSIASAGSSQAHNNIQPSLAVNVFIFSGVL